MFDMRYHIASLVAVFFALAIGIILGAVVGNKGVIVEQQQSLVKRIESNLAELRAENRMLKEEVADQNSFEKQVAPLAIKDRLAEKNVVIVVTVKSDGDVLQSIQDNIKKAGAATYRIEVKDDFKITENMVEELQPYFEGTLNENNARELILKRMAIDLTSEPGSVPEGKEPFILQLKNMDFIETDLALNGPIAPTDAAVIFGGSNADQDPQKTDLHLINQLKVSSIRVIGVETTDCKKSYIEAYQHARIPTIDNINQPMGIISMVFALTGIDGDYGVKDSAERLVPVLQ